MKECILLTDSFPFGKKEPFLETEIHFLSAYFDKICIFSLSNDDNMRYVPKNIKAFSLHLDVMRFKRTRKFLAGLIAHGMRIDRTNPLDVIQCLYFRGGVNIAIKRCQTIINKEGIVLSNAIIYSYWTGFLSAVAIGLSSLLKVNVPIVSRAHAVDFYDYRQPRNFSPFQPYILKNITYICPISIDGERYLLNRYNRFSAKIRTFKLGTNNMGIGPLNKTPIFNVVSCSNIIPLKRLNLILKTLIDIKTKYSAIHWYCFGDGSDLASLKESAFKLGFSDNVTFFGRVKNKDILSFYSKNCVDLFINLSEAEGIPVSIMEAMSFGIPCLATDVGGTREIVNEYNGFLFPKDCSSHDVAEKILEYIKTPQEKKIAKRKIARQYWEDNCDAEMNYLSWCIFLANCDNDM